MEKLKLSDLHITYSNYSSRGDKLREFIRLLCSHLRYKLPQIADDLDFNHATFFRFMSGRTKAMMYSRMVDLADYIKEHIHIRNIVNEYGEKEELMTFVEPKKEDEKI